MEAQGLNVVVNLRTIKELKSCYIAKKKNSKQREFHTRSASLALLWMPRQTAGTLQTKLRRRGFSHSERKGRASQTTEGLVSQASSGDIEHPFPVSRPSLSECKVFKSSNELFGFVPIDHSENYV